MLAVPMIGKTVSHYRVVAQLGGGGMGVVYKAEDMRLQRAVALKFLPENLSKDLNALELFRREARTASTLNHPNICTIHDIDEYEGHPFIVMEFMKGETLKHRLSRGACKIDELLELAPQLANALAAAHAEGILHRDLKPANIFLTDRGQPKILDFGLAKLLSTKGTDRPTMSELPTDDHLTSPGSAVGTVAYMSPEQARGEELDVRSDLFSLGAVLYEMATGHMAFGGDTTAIIFDAILNRSPVAPVRFNAEIPSKLEEILNKLLDKDRKLRYQSAADLEADLRRLRREADVSRSVFVAAPGAVPSASSSQAVGVQELPAKRSRTRILIPIASIVAVAVVAWIFFVLRRPPALGERDSILLADFVNTTGDSAFDGTLKEALAVQLEQSPFIDVFPDDRVQQTLRFMARSPDERVTDSVAREICQREDIKAVLGGSISGLGSHYVITLNAVNCVSGESLAREQREADSKEHVLTELGKAASSLRRKLGESLASIQKYDTPIETATTSSLEALRAHSEGYKLNSRGDYSHAIPLLRRAVELDPNFALGYRALGMVYRNMRETKMARDYSKKAFDLRDRVSERERLFIASSYYENLGDSNKATETLELWKLMYPRDGAAHNNLGVQYSSLGRFEDALKEYEESARLRPKNPISFGNSVFTYTYLNRFEEAKAVAEQAIRQKLDPFNLHIALYNIAAIERDTQGMRREADWAKGKPNEVIMTLAQARAAAASGKLREARRLFKQGLEMAQRAGFNETAGLFRSLEASTEALFGNDREAELQVEQALQLNPSPVMRADLAATMAFAGRAQLVKQWIDELKKEFPEDTFLNSVGIPNAMAALEIYASDGSKAVDLLDIAKPYELGPANVSVIYTRGLAYLLNKSGPEAAAEFQKILDHPGLAAPSPIYSLSRLGLARAHLRAGDLNRARKSYQDFFAIWKDADPDIPILIQVKQEYAMLPANQ